MFMMNFLFDFGQTPHKGTFSGDKPGGVLFQSKNWLKLNPSAAIPEPGDPFPAGFDPEAASWLDQGDMDSGALLIPQSAAPDDSNIGIRIALDPTGLAIPLATSTLTLSVCFGKPSPAGQDRASPFVDATGAVITTFVFVDQRANRPLVGAPVSWFFPLGMIGFRPPGKHRANRYEFAVGISVKNGGPGGPERHFSHDPEMDVAL